MSSLKALITTLKFQCPVIVSYNETPALRTVDDADLPPFGSLSIGYGTGGGLPWQFFLRPQQRADLGFFKIFITTRYIDYSYVPQQSPFDEHNRSRKSMLQAGESPEEGTWDVLVIPVTTAVA